VDRSSRENKPLLFSRQANLIGLRAAEYRARVCGCGKKNRGRENAFGKKKKRKKKKKIIGRSARCAEGCEGSKDPRVTLRSVENGGGR